MAPPVRIAAGRVAGRHPVAGEHGQEGAAEVGCPPAVGERVITDRVTHQPDFGLPSLLRCSPLDCERLLGTVADPNLALAQAPPSFPPLRALMLGIPA